MYSVTEANGLVSPRLCKGFRVVAGLDMPSATAWTWKGSNEMPWKQERWAILGVSSDTALWI